jgi:hypothetical protein
MSWEQLSWEEWSWAIAYLVALVALAECIARVVRLALGAP